MNRVIVVDRTGHGQRRGRILKRALQGSLAALKQKQSEVSATLISRPSMAKLNRLYRGKPRATDVLSFPQDDLRLKNRTYLGDIVIASAIACVQAKRNGWTWEREICWLGIHGLLHLLGYDHQTPRTEKVMLKLQDQLLTEVLGHEG